MTIFSVNSGSITQLRSSGSIGVRIEPSPSLSTVYGILALNGTNGSLVQFFQADSQTTEISGEGGLGMYAHTGTLILGTSNVRRMTISSNGMISTGDSSPSSWGNSYVRGAMQIGGLTSVYTNTTDNASYISNNIYDAGSSVLRYVTNGFASSYQQVSGSHIWNTAGSGTAGGVLTSTERMRLDVNGNLAIGTSSPQTYTNYTVFTVDNSTNGGLVSLRRNGVALLNLFTSASEGRIEGANSAFLSFYTTSNERVRIDTSGNVGIGAIPNGIYRLQVHTTGGPYILRLFNSNTSTDDYCATLISQGASGSATGMIGTGGSATSNAAFRNTFVVGTQTNHAFVLATNDTERVRIDASGNVSIGNTSAAARLHITDTNSALLKLTRTGATAANWTFIHGDSGGFGNLFLYNDSGNYPITARSNGSVGINTIDPQTTLDVNGLMRATQTTFTKATDGKAVFSFGPTSSETINLQSVFSWMSSLVDGNVWAVFGKYCGFLSGQVEVREFYIGRSASGNWSTTQYGPTSNTGASLSSVAGSGTSITITTTAGSYYGLELTVMVR